VIRGAGNLQIAGSGSSPTSRGHASPKGEAAGRKEQTPVERTLDVAVGRNKPTKPVAEQTVGGVRNAEGGKAAGVETCCKDTAGSCREEGTANPREGAECREAPSGQETGCL